MQLYLTKPVRLYLNVAPGSIDTVDTLYTVKIKNHTTKKKISSCSENVETWLLRLLINAVDCSSF